MVKLDIETIFKDVAMTEVDEDLDHCIHLLIREFLYHVVWHPDSRFAFPIPKANPMKDIIEDRSKENEAERTAVMQSIRTAFKEHFPFVGSVHTTLYEDIIKMTLFYVDISDMAAFNQWRKEMMSKHGRGRMMSEKYILLVDKTMDVIHRVLKTEGVAPPDDYLIREFVTFYVDRCKSELVPPALEVVPGYHQMANIIKISQIPILFEALFVRIVEIFNQENRMGPA